MKYKTEIKVYLPTQMVGELHRYKLEGTRSKFVEKAIRNRIDNLDNGKGIGEYSTEHLLCVLRDMHSKEEICRVILGWFK